MRKMASAPRLDRAQQPVPGHGRRSYRDHLGIVREVLTVVLGALLYFVVRGLMETQVTLAFANAETLISLEQQLGLFHEPALQELILGHGWLVDLANRMYIFGHWPLIAAIMVWLLWQHRPWFAVYRSALLISGAIGIVFFVLLPTAPPRYVLDLGMLDTVTQQTNAYRVLQPPGLTNQYAAMPSLHAGWNLLMGIAIVHCATNGWVKVFGYAMPLVMYLATIVTANHYLLDGAVGSMVALAGLAIAWRINGPGAHHSEPGSGEQIPRRSEPSTRSF